MNAGAGTNYVAYSGAPYTTLSAYQIASGKDANSSSVDPLSCSRLTKCNYTPNNGLLNDTGTPVGVTDTLTSDVS